MSWSRALAVSALVWGLAGCGFESLYGSREGQTRDPTVEAHLASITVRPITDRRGQILRNNLLDLLTPKGSARKPLYTLTISLRESEERLGQTTANLATRANLRVTAGFSLVNRLGTTSNPSNQNPAPEGEEDHSGEGTARQDPSVLFSGTRTVVASFDFFQNEFATIKAREDAEERALRDLAREIETQLAVFFAGKTKRPVARSVVR